VSPRGAGIGGGAPGRAAAQLLSLHPHVPPSVILSPARRGAHQQPARRHEPRQLRVSRECGQTPANARSNQGDKLRAGPHAVPCTLLPASQPPANTLPRAHPSPPPQRYVACQSDNAGVLVLSEFAGAAQSLGAGAILVNPWNIADVAQVGGWGLRLGLGRDGAGGRGCREGEKSSPARATVQLSLSSLNPVRTRPPLPGHRGRADDERGGAAGAPPPELLPRRDPHGAGGARGRGTVGAAATLKAAGRRAAQRTQELGKGRVEDASQARPPPPRPGPTPLFRSSTTPTSRLTCACATRRRSSAYPRRVMGAG
jgi:hypothetical protein